MVDRAKINIKMNEIKKFCILVHALTIIPNDQEVFQIAGVKWGLSSAEESLSHANYCVLFFLSLLLPISEVDSQPPKMHIFFLL